MTEGRKNLGYIYVDVTKILRRYAPLNDNKITYFNITIPTFPKFPTSAG